MPISIDKQLIKKEKEKKEILKGITNFTIKTYKMMCQECD